MTLRSLTRVRWQETGFELQSFELMMFGSVGLYLSKRRVSLRPSGDTTPCKVTPGIQSRIPSCFSACFPQVFASFWGEIPISTRASLLLAFMRVFFFPVCSASSFWLLHKPVCAGVPHLQEIAGPYRMPMPSVLRGSSGVGRFLMG